MTPSNWRHPRSTIHAKMKTLDVVCEGSFVQTFAVVVALDVVVVVVVFAFALVS